MSDQHVTTLKKVYGAMTQGDLDAVRAALDPDVVWEGVGELLPAGESHRGVDEVTCEVFKEVARAYEGFRAEPEEFIDAGERVIVLGTFSGRPEGARRSVSTPFAQVVDFDDGRIARVRSFTDTAEWVFALPETP